MLTNKGKDQTKVELASINDAYWVLCFAILCDFFAINELTSAKTIYDYLLVLMLLLIGYFFFYKAFKISSLAYEGEFIFIRKIGNSLYIPLSNVMEIKRDGALLRI